MYEEKQRKMRLIILAVILLIVIVFVFRNYQSGKQRNIAGIREPIQTEASGVEHTVMSGYDITMNYHYAYDIEGLVVCTNNYYGISPEDKLSPKDVGLAWGKVAELNTQVGFHWQPTNRGIKNKIDSQEKLALVGTVSDVLLQYSNNHLIALDDSVRKAIKRIKVGDHVRIQGYLVNVDGTSSSKKDFYWYSSTSRDDIGGNACEIILVKNIEWMD